MSKKHHYHKVKTHHWQGGVLKSITHFFNEIEEALNFAKSSDANAVKVYDTNGDLVHSDNLNPTLTSTYA